MAHGPYRGGPSSERGAPAEEGGLVDELIAQFADPLAFYRELVQNSVDAGARAIRVTLAWEPDEGGMARVSVRDDGAGMGREVLEEQLTVLFRSGKEGQAGKIGKFGVGFVSVLAVEPALVTVRTSEGEGPTWTLQLHADQRYELFRGEGERASGTTVTLLVPMAREAFEGFAEGSERALVTWCRHVEVPLSLVAMVTGADTPLREARIDRPFGVDALVEVEGHEGSTRVAAGVLAEPKPYLAFFNRGLLLHETTATPFRGVAVKIQDDRLEHTLSRDDVRRDEHYERAMRFAARVVERQLEAELRDRLAAYADGRVTERGFHRLAAAAVRAGIGVEADEVAIPLLHPAGGRRSIPRLVARARRGVRRRARLADRAKRSRVAAGSW